MVKPPSSLWFPYGFPQASLLSDPFSASDHVFDHDFGHHWPLASHDTAPYRPSWLGGRCRPWGSATLNFRRSNLSCVWPTPHPSDQPLRSIWRCCGPSCRLPLCKPFVWWMLRREVRAGWTLHAGIVCKVGFRQDSCGFWVECGDHVGVRWHIEHGQGLRRHLLPSQPHLRPRQALHGRGPWGALWGMPQHLLPQQFAFLYGLAREVGSSHDIHIQKTKGFSGFIQFYTFFFKYGFYTVSTWFLHGFMWLCNCFKWFSMILQSSTCFHG